MSEELENLQLLLSILQRYGVSHYKSDKIQLDLNYIPPQPHGAAAVYAQQDVARRDPELPMAMQFWGGGNV